MRRPLIGRPRQSDAARLSLSRGAEVGSIRLYKDDVITERTLSTGHPPAIKSLILILAVAIAIFSVLHAARAQLVRGKAGTYPQQIKLQVPSRDFNR